MTDKYTLAQWQVNLFSLTGEAGPMDKKIINLVHHELMITLASLGLPEDYKVLMTGFESQPSAPQD